jgi:hypothetical protein
MKIYELLAPLGIVAYAALAIAFLTWLLKFKFHVKWVNIKWHIWAGILAMIFASLHLAIFIYTNL